MARYNGTVTQYDKNYDFYIEVTYEQSVVNNLTTVTVKEYLYRCYNSVNSNASGEITINGESSGTLSKKYQWTGSSSWVTMELFSFTQDVQHNADGTCDDIPITATFVCVAGGAGPGTCEAKISLPVPTIPRASAVSAPNGTISKTIKIAISRASTRFTHTLRYTLGESSGVIATGVGTSYTWTPDMELCRQITEAVSGTATITCTTYSGDTIVGSKSCEITLTVPDTVQLVCSDGWASVSPYNADGKAKDIAAFVAGHSKAAVSFDNSLISTEDNYGAGIASYKAVYSSKTLEDPYRTDILTAGVHTITCYVYDTRGRSVAAELSFEVLPYSAPTLGDISVYRCAEDGTADNSGYYLYVKALAEYSELAGLNAITLTAKYMPTGGEESEPYELENGVGEVIGAGLITPASSYMVYLEATDRLGTTATYDTKIPTKKTFMRAREDGNGVGFNKVPEHDGGMDVDWDLYLNGHQVYGWNWLDLIYPVGSIYIAYHHTDPATLFGGTWERITGQFLLAAAESDTIGETGGEETHKLTAAELPKHRHTISDDGAHTHTIGYDTDTAGGGGYASVHKSGSDGATGTSPTSESGEHDHGGYTGYIGSSTAHNNMPPYIKVSVWRRTA